MSSEAPEPDRLDRPGRPAGAPIRRLRVVPNPVATPVAAASAPSRPGGRHRKPDPDDEIDVEGGEVPDAATDVVPAQRVGWVTMPLPGA